MSKLEKDDDVVGKGNNVVKFDFFYNKTFAVKEIFPDK